MYFFRDEIQLKNNERMKEEHEQEKLKTIMYKIHKKYEIRMYFGRQIRVILEN